MRTLIAAIVITVGSTSVAWTQSPTVVDSTFDSKGVNIRYLSDGDGIPVVLIHGWMGDASMWGGDANGKPKPKAPPGFRVIVFDCRGHGASGKPHDPKEYGSAMADDVVRLLDHLKIEKAHLVGYSSGAFIAGHVVAHHSDRVRSVIYAGQAPVLKEHILETDFSDCELFAKTVETGADLGIYLRDVMPASRPKPSEDQAKALAKIMYHGKDVKVYAAAGRSFRDLAVSIDALKKCPAPIAFIHGSKESDHVKSRVAMVRETLGRGELTLIDDGDHITTLTKPAFGQAIIDFWKRETK